MREGRERDFTRGQDVLHNAGEVTSQVTAHLNHSKGILSASIRTDTEHYFIEPSSRHFNQSHDFHMISYRGSDIKQDVRRSVIWE